MLVINYIQVSVLLLLAVVSDIRTYKIKNSITLSFIVIGLLTNTLFNGYEGMIFSLKGILFPVVILIWLFALKMLGAGDIKLLSAIGSILGSKFVLQDVLYSFISGGVMAVIIMLIRKNGRQRIAYLMNYLKTCFITFSFPLYTIEDTQHDTSRFPFSIAILSGTVIAILYPIGLSFT